MSHYAESHPLQDSDSCTRCPHCHNAATGSRITVVLHTLTLVLLAVLLGGGALIYTEVRRDINTMQQPAYWVNALFPPSGGPANVPPAVVNVAAATMGGAFDQWFLGSLNGTIAGFLNRFATSDFASLGKEVAQLTSTLMASISATCPQGSSVVCPAGGNYLQCADGNVVYCQYAGEVVSCGSSCQVSQAYEPLSVVQSVAAAIANLPAVPSANPADPAFSSGPFALSVLLQWVRAQTAIEPWVAAAQSCVKLADNVMANDWSGAYKDFSGSAEGWNANQQVQSTAQSVLNVCQAVANMTA